MTYKDKDYHKKYYQRNSKKILEKQKEYYQKPEIREKMKEYHKKYYQKNKEREKKRHKEHYEKNKEHIKEQRKKHYEKNKEKKKEYRRKNKDKINNYSKIRRKKDKNFKIAGNLRNSLWKSLKYYSKTGKIMTSKQIGIDYKKIIEYLEPFPKDLTNYHIHHIKPLFTFNFVNPDGSTNLEEVRKAFSPKNHKWVTKEEHKEIHSKLNYNLYK